MKSNTRYIGNRTTRLFLVRALSIGMLFMAGILLLGLARADAIYEHVSSFGGEGSQPGRFKYPMDVEVDVAGNIYVADMENGRIQKFDRGGNLISIWSNLFTDKQGYSVPPWPIQILSFSDGSFIFRDRGNLSISKIDSAGEIQQTWVPQYELDDRGLMQSVHPNFIENGPGGSVYVAETVSKGSGGLEVRVRRYSEDGAYISQIFKDSDPYRQSGGIGVDGQGNLYSFDRILPNKKYIIKHSPEGAVLSKWGIKHTKTKESRLIEPYDIEVDQRGYVFVSEKGRRVIKKFSAEGKYLGKWGRKGKGSGEFWAPKGMATDADGNIYVADSGNHQVHKFRPDITRPVIKRLRTSRRRLSIGQGSRTARFSLILSEDATVRMTAMRKKKGSVIKAGAVSFKAQRGKVTRKFRGYLGQKQMPVGSYKIVMTAEDSAGNRSKAKGLNLRVTGR